MPTPETEETRTEAGSTLALFWVFLKLGLTSFGGPIAHIGYFREAFVERRRWLDERSYADLVALCQFLPGPASSQVGIAVGMFRGGYPGALAAWVGFTLPSALLMTLFGLTLVELGDDFAGGWIRGLKIVAVAVVAQALWGMGRSLCPDRLRATFAVAAAIGTLAFHSALGQVAVILAGGLLGTWLIRQDEVSPVRQDMHVKVGIRTGVLALVVFFTLLVSLPLLAAAVDNPSLNAFDSFYRAGSLVFGGGHVVLPLLQSEVVPAGWVSNDAFLAGYGAAQAVPGPLFTFAAYLGSVSTLPPNGWYGALICLVAIFLPSFLLVVGALPLWNRLRRYKHMQRAMAGVNAAVVGLLLAAFYDPVWTSAIRGTIDFSLAVGAFLALEFWKLPPWLVVMLGAAAGAALI